MTTIKDGWDIENHIQFPVDMKCEYQSKNGGVNFVDYQTYTILSPDIKTIYFISLVLITKMQLYFD